MEDDYSALIADSFTNPLSFNGFSAAEILAGQSNQTATTPDAGTQGTNNDPLVLRYPKQRLDATADYLSMSIFDYESNQDIYGLTKGDKPSDNDSLANLLTGLGNKADKIEKILEGTEEEKKLMTNLQQIYLPMPQSISDAMSVGYAEDTLNPLQVAGLNIAKTLGDAAFDKAARDSVFKNLGEISKLGVGSNEIEALKNAVAAKAINQLGANVNPQSIITRASGQILQSNLELLFNNVTLRSFPFAFDFAPRNPDEANEVALIIRTIKRGMMPRKGENPAIFIKSPKLFKLRYMSGTDPHPFLNKMKTGVVTDMSVNYTGSNTYATYDDGTPVHMTMQFTFKEINPIYADDYEVEGDTALAAGTGVGY